MNTSNSSLDCGADVSSSEQLHIVEIGAEHLTLLVDLFERNRDTSVTETFDPFALTSEQAEELALTAHNDRYFAVATRDTFIAMSMLRGFDEGYEIPSFGIFVDIGWHGNGIGRLLTEATIAMAREQGSPAIRLTVYADNLGAIHLYRSLGFQERERGTVQRRGGIVEKIVMTLPLAV